MCDLTFEDATKENPKKKKLYEGTWKCQNGWITWLPWVEGVIDHKGLVHQVQCKVCTHVNKQFFLLIPKVDSLLKHIGHCKCKVSMFNIDARFYYYNKDSTHAKWRIPNSLIDSNVSLRWKQWKSKELGHAPWLVTLWG
jgi:hypothetical protein